MDPKKDATEDFGSSAQSVQRCSIQSDTRYGVVHRVISV